MAIHESVGSRPLPNQASSCVVPDSCVTGVCDELVFHVRRAVVDGVRVPEKDGRWVGVLRRIVTAKLGKWSLEGDVAQDAQLMVSELMSNALLHGDQQTEIGFRFILTCKMITIAVNGGVPYQPRAVLADGDCEGGRGLFLVAKTASAWGIGDDGTTTWCSLALPAPEVAPLAYAPDVNLLDALDAALGEHAATSERAATDLTGLPNAQLGGVVGLLERSEQGAVDDG